MVTVLRSLELLDFAIADRVTVGFAPGLNVLTGETGAGKSLLVDALALLAGDRADAGVVRSGSEAAVVQATWGEPPELVASRRIVREGRNLVRVDGVVVTVGELQAALAPRLGIFGQQSFRTLLDPGEQRAALDRHLDAEAVAAAREVADAWRAQQEAAARTAALRADARERARSLDVLRYQLDEIDAADLQSGEDAALDARLATLRHLERVRAGVAEALSALAVAEHNAADLLASAWRALAAASRHDVVLAPLVNETADALAATQAVARELEAALERLEAEPGELDAAEARRARIDALERKYGDGVAGVLAARDRMATELARWESSEADVAAWEARLADARTRLAAAAGRLSQGRSRAAADLAPAVEEVLRRLALPNARFEIDLEARPEVGPHGAERVAFRFGANVGEPAAPLREVASGGELSRVMLALHTAAGSDLATLVFDEVDAGLGGRSGRAVGEALARLSRGRQVLVVTHLAQVAAFADHHLRVDKDEAGGRTRTRVTALSGDDRVRELARMLAGDEGDEAMRHARSLLRDPSGT